MGIWSGNRIELYIRIMTELGWKHSGQRMILSHATLQTNHLPLILAHANIVDMGMCVNPCSVIYLIWLVLTIIQLSVSLRPQIVVSPCHCYTEALLYPVTVLTAKLILCGVCKVPWVILLCLYGEPRP